MRGPDVDSVTMAKAKREARQLGCSLSYKQEFCEWTLCHTATGEKMFFDSLTSAMTMAPHLAASQAAQSEPADYWCNCSREFWDAAKSTCSQCGFVGRGQSDGPVEA